MSQQSDLLDCRRGSPTVRAAALASLRAAAAAAVGTINERDLAVYAIIGENLAATALDAERYPNALKRHGFRQ
jgi:hypothetical protein